MSHWSISAHSAPRQVNRALSELDTDGDGEISRPEFAAWWLAGDRSLLPALRAYWVRVRPWASEDGESARGPGLVPRDYIQTHEQWAQSYRGLAASFGLAEGPVSDANIADMFDAIDEDDSGLLDRAEVEKMLAGLGRAMGAGEVDRAMGQMDADGSGEVDVDEFTQWWRANEAIEEAARAAGRKATAERRVKASQQAAFFGRLYGEAPKGRKPRRHQQAPAGRPKQRPGSGKARPGSGKARPGSAAKGRKLLDRLSAVKVPTKAAAAAGDGGAEGRRPGSAAGRRPGSAARRAGGGWVGDLLHNHGVDGFLEQKMQARRWGARRSLVISD
jgi:hypothetical protein